MKAQFVLTLLAAASLLVGCAKTDSDNIRTAGIHASLSVESGNGTTAVAYATFQVGGPTGTYMNLTNGDFVTVDGHSMSRSEIFGIITYSAGVPYAEGGAYTFTLHRSGEGSYSSTVVLPEGFSILGPGPHSHQPKGAELDVTWAGIGWDDPMHVTLYKSWPNGSSIVGHSTFFSDGGLLFSAGETTEPAAVGAIDADVTVERRTSGTVSSAFDGGSARGIQRRRVDFTLD